MITINQLTARDTVTSQPWRETRGILTAAHAEVSPGRFVHITLGQAGVMVYRGERAVGIPLAELLRLAGEADAELAPETPAEAPVAGVRSLPIQPSASAPTATINPQPSNI